MKKTVIISILIIFCTSLLSACTPTGYSNILLLTDNLNSINKELDLSLESYTLKNNCYKLILSDGNSKALLSAEEDEKGNIKKVRFTLSKTDNNGNFFTPSQEQTDFYKARATEIIEAFTLFEKGQCLEITEKILPLKSDDFSKTGELTMEAENFHIVYYSNVLCCQLTVSDTYLEKTELTQKPVSKPLYEATANISP